MKIAYRNVRSQVLEATPAELAWVNDFLTYEDRSLRYARANGDSRVRLLNTFDQSFPSGFVRSLRAAAVEPGFTFEVDDQRLPPCSPDPTADIGWLRDYQREAVDKAIKAERGILWMPTGAGKTEVAAALAKTLRCRWLFVVPQADLIYQTAERFERRTGEKAGVVGDGEWTEARFTVATFQTLAAAVAGRSSVEKQRAAAALLGAVEGLIVDECHTLPADSVLSVVSKTRNAFWRFGLSGTPLARGDRKSLLAIGALGGIIHRIKPEVLIEAGALSKPTIRVVPCVQASARPSWQGVYGELVVKSKQRNQTVVNMAVAAQKPAFVFVQHVKHGKILKLMLESAGLRADFVWGAHETWLRSKILDRLTSGKLDVVVCSSVFQQAIDVPSLRSVVNAAGGASVIQTIQRIGRGTRVTEDKTTFEVWDVADRGNRWLERHTRERVRAYEGEGYEVASAPEYAAPDAQGRLLDPATVNAEAEYRAAQKVAKDALRALTGEASIRKRR